MSSCGVGENICLRVGRGHDEDRPPFRNEEKAARGRHPQPHQPHTHAGRRVRHPQAKTSATPSCRRRNSRRVRSACRSGRPTQPRSGRASPPLPATLTSGRAAQAADSSVLPAAASRRRLAYHLRPLVARAQISRRLPAQLGAAMSIAGPVQPPACRKSPPPLLPQPHRHPPQRRSQTCCAQRARAS